MDRKGGTGRGRSPTPEIVQRTLKEQVLDIDPQSFEALEDDLMPNGRGAITVAHFAPEN
jgi:hypothetical protein